MRFDIEVRIGGPQDDNALLEKTNRILSAYGISPLHPGELRTLMYRADNFEWRRLTDELRQAGANQSYLELPIIERNEVADAELLQLEIRAWFGGQLDRSDAPGDVSPVPRLSLADLKEIRRRDLVSSYIREVLISDKVVRALEREKLTGWNVLPLEQAAVIRSSREASRAYYLFTANEVLPPVDSRTLVVVEYNPEILDYGPDHYLTGRRLPHGGTSGPLQMGPLIYQRNILRTWKDFNVTNEIWNPPPTAHRALVITQRAWAALKPFATKNVFVWPVVLV